MSNKMREVKGEVSMHSGAHEGVCLQFIAPSASNTTMLWKCKVRQFCCHHDTFK